MNQTNGIGAAKAQDAPLTRKSKEETPIDRQTELYIKTKYESLSARLNKIWRTEENGSYTERWEAGPLDRTKKMCEAIIDARVRETFLAPQELVVAVPGFGTNYGELLPWLHAGPTVYAIEEDSSGLLEDNERRELKERFPNLVPIDIGEALPKKADIVVWTHPHTQNFPALFKDILKNDGILIIQSEFYRAFMGPIIENTTAWKVILHERVNLTDFFMGSPFLAHGGSVVIAKKIGDPTPVIERFARLLGMTDLELKETVNAAGNHFDTEPLQIDDVDVSCIGDSKRAINTLKGKARTELAIHSVTHEAGFVCHHTCLFLNCEKIFAVESELWLRVLGMKDEYEHPHNDLPKHRLVPIEVWLAGMKLALDNYKPQEYELSLRTQSSKIKKRIGSAKELKI